MNAELIDKMIASLPRVSEADARKWQWKYEVLPRLRQSRLPERFWFIADKWKAEQKATLDEIRPMLTGRGAIIALVGKRGVGKTTICGQLIIERALNEALYPWDRISPYWKLSELLATFKALYANFGSKDMDALLHRHTRLCHRNGLLVIDELHDCEDAQIKNRFLTDTLDKRYANLVDTIIISNQTPEQFAETTDDSVRSRMREHGCIIDCTWESWR